MGRVLMVPAIVACDLQASEFPRRALLGSWVNTDNLPPKEIMVLIIVEHARESLAMLALSCHIAD
jgi:hypothetical protein